MNFLMNIMSQMKFKVLKNTENKTISLKEDLARHIDKKHFI